MNILLLYTPSWIRFQPHPPMGIATISSSLEEDGHNVEVCDLELTVWIKNAIEYSNIKLKLLTDYPLIKKYILNEMDDSKAIEVSREFHRLYELVDINGFEVIGFSCMSIRQFSTALLFAQKIKIENEKIVIVMGGEFVSNNAKEIANKYKFIDYLFIGHAFESFPKFINHIAMREKLDVDSIPGIYSNTHKYNNPRHVKINLDKMPLPNYHNFPFEDYKKIMNHLYKENFDYLILKYLLTTGCTHDCTFCNRHVRTPFKLKKCTKIVDDISKLAAKHQTKFFSFECNEINPSNDWLKDLCGKMEGNLNILWYTYARPNNLDADILNNLSNAGCKILRFGVESGSQRILDKMNKKLNVNEMEQILRDSNNAGIWNHVNLIVGFCNETKDDINKTVDFIEKNAPNIDSIKINPFYLNSHSYIMQNPDEWGLRITNKKIDLVEYDEVNGMSWEEIKEETINSVEEIYNVMNKNNIGFTGSSMDLLFSAMVHFDSKQDVKNWLREKHPYLFEKYPIQILMWHIYHPFEMADMPYKNSWEYFIGRWGGSYETL